MTSSILSQLADFPILTLLTLVPLASAALVLALPGRALRLAAFGAILNLVLSFCLLALFDSDKPGIQLLENFDALGMHYQTGVDGANIMFVPLATVLGSLGLLYTLITRHRRDSVFIASLLAYQGIMIGAFVALNALQFWLWTFLELVPVIALTLDAGVGLHRDKVLGPLLRYWLSGLGMSLLGFLLLGYVMWENGLELNFNWENLKHLAEKSPFENLIFMLLFFSCAIRMPLFPFHSWLPPLAERGSISMAVFLHGLKISVYGLIRFVLPLTPLAAAHWTRFAVTLGIIGIFYGALLALMQINIRRWLAFAVISHTGMLVIGAFLYNDLSLEGCILLSLSYGLATAGMLLAIGLVYERTRTSLLPRLGGLMDSNTTIGILFFISAFSTMDMPGTPGFDAVHMLMEGSIEEGGWFKALAILLGNVLATAFLLWAFQRVFLMRSERAIQPYGSLNHPRWQENIIAFVICCLLLATGIYPAPLMRFIDQEAGNIEHEMAAPETSYLKTP